MGNHSDLRTTENALPRSLLRTLIAAGLTIAIAAMVGISMFQLPEGTAWPTPPARETLQESGVDQAVTAVLLNFRSYDTWLEVVVLLVAMLAVLTIRRQHHFALQQTDIFDDPVIRYFSRLVVPFMVLTSGYLLWLGTRLPGGAFQAGAVLAATLLLLVTAGQAKAGPVRSSRLLLLIVLAGFLAFSAVAIVNLGAGNPMLQYRSGREGLTILAIETAVTISIGLTLALLYFTGLASRNRVDSDSTHSMDHPYDPV